MFKRASFEEEIFQNMERNLVSQQVEEATQSDKLARAANCLQSAAEIFAQAGMNSQVDDIREVLHGMVKDLSRKTS